MLINLKNVFMKELEKTKRISIAAVLTILLVIIALFSYNRPKHLYAESIDKSMDLVTNTDYLLSVLDIENLEVTLVDVRSNIEYYRGHLDSAINIYAPEILEDENASIFKDLKEKNKTVVLYGQNPNDALIPVMLLKQLGYDNVKLLNIDLFYDQDKLIVKKSHLELNKYDINKFIEESVKKAAAKPKPKPRPKPVVKKVIPKKKKKKMPVEGGC